LARDPTSLGQPRSEKHADRIRPHTVAGYAKSVIDCIQSARSEFPLTLNVRLPRVKIKVHLEEGRIATAIRRNFVRAERDVLPLAPRPTEIFVAHPGLKGVPPPASWAEEPYRPHEVALLLERAGLRASYFHDLDYWQMFDAKAALGVQLMRGRDDYPPWEPGAPLRPFLHWHYANLGMRLAHCGTLGLNGSGVLLAGAGGSGKSGTVVAGLLNGLQSIGDDYVLLESDLEVVGYPVFATLKQDQAGFDRLGLKNRLVSTGTLNWQGKYEFRICDIGGAPPPPARMVFKALLVPRLAGDAKTAIEAISQRDAMLAFAPSSIHQMPGERETGFAFFARVTKQLPCYAISLGKEPAELAAAIAAFLEQAAE
jgi:hypothetical protein